jgi:hypothetical protein
MKPRLAMPLAALLLAVAVVAYWQLSERPSNEDAQAPGGGEASSSPQQAGRLAASPATASAGKNDPRSDTKSITDADWKKLLEMMSNGGGFPALDDLTEADMERFLAAKGNTPANYLAAWFCTRKVVWLDRALERFPKSPMVLLAKIGEGDPKNPDLELVRRFNEAAPDNPLPKFFEANALFNAGDKEAGVAAIREALAKPGFYTWMNESIDGARSLFEFSGVHPVMADIASTFQLPLPYLSMAMASSRGLIDVYKESAATGEPNPALLEMTYKMGQMFETPEASRTLIGQLVGASIQKMSLQNLPVDATPAWLSIKPADRLTQLEALRTDLPKLTTSTEWLYQRENAHLLGEYLQRFRTEGERAAMNWLNQKENER